MRFVLIAAAAALTAACAHVGVVNTGETPPQTQTTASPTPTGPSDPNLVDAHAYYVTSDNIKGYYFTTPSGKWSCAILSHEKVGCQSTGGTQAMGVAGAPEKVRTPDGDAVAPNAITVGDEGEPGFAWADRPGFAVPSGSAPVLGFDQTLAAAGFRCNVQEAGVSCENEMTRKGFTFSAESYQPQYTPVPG